MVIWGIAATPIWNPPPGKVRAGGRRGAGRGFRGWASPSASMAELPGGSTPAWVVAVGCVFDGDARRGRYNRAIIGKPEAPGNVLVGAAMAASSWPKARRHGGSHREGRG